MNKCIIPQGYRAPLYGYDMQRAIEFVKSSFQENLKLAEAVAEAVKADYPTVMRPITLRNSNYNQHKSLGSMLVEVGAAGNSLDEALNSARIFADGFARVLLATEAE